MANPTRTPEMLNGPEWLQMYKEAWTNDGKVGTPQLPAGLSWEEASKTNTNWVDETIETGFKQRYVWGSKSHRKVQLLHRPVLRSER